MATIPRALMLRYGDCVTAWHASAESPERQPLTLTVERYTGPVVVALLMPSRLS